MEYDGIGLNRWKMPLNAEHFIGLSSFVPLYHLPEFGNDLLSTFILTYS